MPLDVRSAVIFAAITDLISSKVKNTVLKALWDTILLPILPSVERPGALLYR